GSYQRRVALSWKMGILSLYRYETRYDNPRVGGMLQLPRHQRCRRYNFRSVLSDAASYSKKQRHVVRGIQGTKVNSHEAKKLFINDDRRVPTAPVTNVIDPRYRFRPGRPFGKQLNRVAER